MPNARAAQAVKESEVKAAIASAARIAELAKKEMTRLTGQKPDTVSGLRREDDGWHVTVDMVELRRIPESNDVLDTYHVLLDDQGKLVKYDRTRRFLRCESLEHAAEA